MVYGAAISAGTHIVSSSLKGQDAFQGLGFSMLTGALGGAASFGIGGIASGLSGAGKFAFQTVAHGTLGGAMNVIGGGDFATGFIAGGIGSVAGGIATKLNMGGVGITVVGAFSGGVGSYISGGEFWDGFRNGAISAGLNHGMHNPTVQEKQAQLRRGGLYSNLYGPRADGSLGEALWGGNLALSKDILDGSTFRLYNQKGSNLSPKLYLSGWNGGSVGQIKTYGTGMGTGLLTGGGYALGLINVYSIEQQYGNRTINEVQRGFEQGSNVISMFGGLEGAAWGIGWELGRTISHTQSYQDFKNKVWFPFRKENFGY